MRGAQHEANLHMIREKQITIAVNF